MKSATKPLVAAIHRFALDDGPGIRTTVFMKGCPLSCRWCHNPEMIRPAPEIFFSAEKCISCGDCFEICPSGAIRMNAKNRIVRKNCTGCGECARVCPTLALKPVGTPFTPDELACEILRDKVFYDTSGGGVTFSGGEPALYMDYLSEVTAQLKSGQVSVAIQTAGLFDLKSFEQKLLPYLDLIFFDLKLLDAGEHRRWTGRGNKTILSNFLELTKRHRDLIFPRVPLIPSITATRENLAGIAGFLRKAGYRRYELLPYHSGGVGKRRLLGGRAGDFLASLRLDEKTLKRCERIFAEHFFGSEIKAESPETERASAPLRSTIR